MHVYVVIDIECLYDVDGSLVVKEFAVMSTTKPELFSKTFKPPRGWSELPLKVRWMNGWEFRNKNHILWSAGLEDYEKLEHRLLESIPPHCILFTKGKEKCYFLSALLNKPIYELGEIGCPKARMLENPRHRFRCCNNDLNFSHRIGSHCAVVRCLLYVAWLKDNFILNMCVNSPIVVV